MRIFDWMARLETDRRVLALSEDQRDGATWVYAECKSAWACESLFDQLWTDGWRTLGRRGHQSLWLERVE